jgi:cell wall-associated NlpC family hydrolase
MRRSLPTDHVGTPGRRRWRIRWITRAATLVLTVGIVAGGAGAALAAPGPLQAFPGAAPSSAAAAGPSGGSVPVAAGPLTLPPKPDPVAPPSVGDVGPFAVEIMTASADAERLGEQLKVVNDDLATANDILAQFQTAYDLAHAHLGDVQARAAAIARDVYQDATALGPFDQYAGDLQDLGLVAPGLPDQLGQNGRPDGRDSIGLELAQAEQADAAAKTALDLAQAARDEVAGRAAIVQQQFQQRQQALVTLRARNSSLLDQANSLRDAYETALATSRNPGSNTAGLRAAPAAMDAVTFALKQLGKNYVWATEGPNTYDCSGLVLASYRSVGVNMPRVSRDQYWAGQRVAVQSLLPGDLLFFSTDRADPRQIHHVAMYIGGGMMVHAPGYGQKVKISPIWWSEFFGATRMVPAIGGTQGPVTIPTVPQTTTAPPTTTSPPTSTTTQASATATSTNATSTATQPAATTTTTDPPVATTTTATATPSPTATTTATASATPSATGTTTGASPLASLVPTTILASAAAAAVARHRRQRRWWRPWS